ncbi:haloacid dehalogenase [Betaproteobacteria bacterium]|nr:haloacid dehalogenase [Betaproteobacteria bacterium]GHU43280.1 haloacid dehalogenase [Betaproteobacteria bacterium]
MQLVLFDLDNTLLSGDSDFAWSEFLIKKGVLDKATQAAKNQEFFVAYQEGTLDIHEFLNFQLQPLAAHPRATLEAWHTEFMNTRIRPMMGKVAHAKVRAHREAGHLCALVTATNSFVTGPIARAFGIEHLIATIPASENGAFTGAVRGIPSFRKGKVVRVEAWLEALGLHWGSFSDTWFYSDSHNDLPLLEKVSHPVAANPDERLARLAGERGWEIIRLC